MYKVYKDNEIGSSYHAATFETLYEAMEYIQRHQGDGWYYYIR